MSFGAALLGVRVAGTLMRGEGAAASAKYNAAVAAQNAQIARQQGIAAVEAQQREAARRIGSAMANYGASGVQMDVGSPVDVLVDSARNIELDRLTVQYNYALKAMGYEAQSRVALQEAKSARTSALFNAFGSVAEYGYDNNWFGSNKGSDGSHVEAVFGKKSIGTR